VLAAATTFLGFAVLTFLPIFAQKIFHEGANTYSHLMAFSGAGSIVGALLVAWLGKYKKMGLTALVVQAIYGALIIAFALSRTLWVSDILLFFTGATLMIVFSTVTSLVQLIAPNEMRVGDEHLHAGVPRHAVSQPGQRLATSLGAPMVIGINGVSSRRGDVLPVEPRSTGDVENPSKHEENKPRKHEDAKNSSPQEFRVFALSWR
jgi:predicted MFS family arabinose efflux permease